MRELPTRTGWYWVNDNECDAWVLGFFDAEKQSLSVVTLGGYREVWHTVWDATVERFHNYDAKQDDTYTEVDPVDWREIPSPHVCQKVRDIGNEDGRHDDKPYV